MDNYEKFREIIDTHISGAPKSKLFDEILRFLFTPEEIDLAVHMKFNGRSIEELSLASGISAPEVDKRIKSMLSKGRINYKEKNGVKLFNLLPTVPGIFETSMMKNKDSPMHKRLAKLWYEYHDEALIKSLSGMPTPQMRVVPIKESIKPGSVILSYEEISGLIEKSDFIAITNCACRVSAKKCNSPLETCIAFGQLGKNLVEFEFARAITKNEAMDILQKCEDAGLVHISNNYADRANIICNCCRCCCHFLRGITDFNMPNMLAPSKFVASVNKDLCTGCGTCVDERCPVKAIEINADTANVLGGKCIGCGLCASGCPSGAVKLNERQDPPNVPKTLMEMGIKIMQEKGKLEKFLKATG